MRSLGLLLHTRSRFLVNLFVVALAVVVGNADGDKGAVVGIGVGSNGIMLNDSSGEFELFSSSSLIVVVVVVVVSLVVSLTRSEVATATAAELAVLLSATWSVSSLCFFLKLAADFISMFMTDAVDSFSSIQLPNLLEDA